MEKEKLDHFKRILESLAEEIETSLNSGRDLTAVVSLDAPRLRKKFPYRRHGGPRGVSS